MKQKFEEYDSPTGKWGWFHFYNPVNDTFAHQHMYDDDRTLIDNLRIGTYQEIALTAIFGDDFENIKETKLLNDINNSISEIYEFIYNSDSLKNSGISDLDPFLVAFYLLAKDYKKLKIHILSQRKVAGLFILLVIDCLIRDCKYKIIEHIIFSAHRFDTIIKILCPSFDFEKNIFFKSGKKKGEKTREQVISDYKTMGNSFWEKETKYEGKINLLMILLPGKLASHI